MKLSTVNQAEISVHEVLQINGHHTFLSFNLELQQGAAKKEQLKRCLQV